MRAIFLTALVLVGCVRDSDFPPPPTEGSDLPDGQIQTRDQGRLPVGDAFPPADASPPGDRGTPVADATQPEPDAVRAEDSTPPQDAAEDGDVAPPEDGATEQDRGVPPADLADGPDDGGPVVDAELPPPTPDATADAAAPPPEVCDGIDNDADGRINESLNGSCWCKDQDGDGHPTCEVTYLRPQDAPAGWAFMIPDEGISVNDCRDDSSLIYPGAPEVCLPRGQDDDCDGRVDEGPDGQPLDCD